MKPSLRLGFDFSCFGVTSDAHENSDFERLNATLVLDAGVTSLLNERRCVIVVAGRKSVVVSRRAGRPNPLLLHLCCF